VQRLLTSALAEIRHPSTLREIEQLDVQPTLREHLRTSLHPLHHASPIGGLVERMKRSDAGTIKM
jgi:hypothetical protein